MVDIDYIMSLLDWNMDINEQAKGINLASDVENFNVFIQPCNKKYNKNVWDNCAKILAQKTDDQLSPYLIELLKWLQDLNWPGALCILHRLQEFEQNSSFDSAYHACLNHAQAMKDDVWENNLKLLEKPI